MNAAKATNDDKPRAKKSYKKLFILIGVILFSIIMYLGMQPLRGTINFGICKVFIERSSTYPDEIRYTSLLERPTDVRIDYVVLNEFGEYESRSTTCVFRPDPVTGIALSDVITDRLRADPDKVARFNVGIPAIIAYPPDLATPGILKDNLAGLWRGY